ncbi:hypothetical protein SLEP1_g16319 [Rubroshorea leprosula]|uniref:Maturase K n=1 Tax=Rubroshorea leprosula TaxID=152421 RepID=A0AAV5IQI5_9ROSI|nr:hypothetical protein SLEP1_g16319 [Rubroshorea leprosula]
MSRSPKSWYFDGNFDPKQISLERFENLYFELAILSETSRYISLYFFLRISEVRKKKGYNKRPD